MIGKDEVCSFTVVVCGDPSVGKTSLINRLTKDVFISPSKTQVLGLMTPTVVDLGDRRVRLMLWDTPSHDDYREVTTCHLAEAQACLLVFALNDRHSFDSIFEVWNPVLDSYSKVPHVTFLVGTKSDLCESAKVVRIEDTEKATDILTFFVSSTDGSQIAALKTELAKKLASAFPARSDGPPRDCCAGPLAAGGSCGCLLL